MRPSLTGQEWLELQRIRLDGAKGVGKEAIERFLYETGEQKGVEEASEGGVFAKTPSPDPSPKTLSTCRTLADWNSAMRVRARALFDEKWRPSAAWRVICEEFGAKAIHVSSIGLWFREWKQKRANDRRDAGTLRASAGPAKKRTSKDRPKGFPAEMKERTLALLRHGLNVSAVMRALQSEHPPGTRIPARFTIHLWAKEAGIAPPNSARGGRKPGAGRPARLRDAVANNSANVGQAFQPAESPHPDPLPEGEGDQEEDDRLESLSHEDPIEPEPELPAGMMPCLRDKIPVISVESCLEWQTKWRCHGADPQSAWAKVKDCRSCPQWVPKAADLPVTKDPSRPETRPRDAAMAGL